MTADGFICASAQSQQITRVMANRRKDRSPKPDYQRKQGKPGAKSLRGCPEIYDEKKRQFNITLTPKAIATLAEIATAIGESRSQVIEKAIRGEINLLEIVKSEVFTLEEAEKIAN